ncbi:MAG: FHA domain-containing protein [Vicinamibacteria bacterium]|nr:FHA domain-containing protein [Vicinamibacteria bacterium]
MSTDLLTGIPCPHCGARAQATATCVACGETLAVGVLEVVRGVHKGESFALLPLEYSLGRASECDIVLRDPSISRHHARLRWDPPSFVISDAGSAHGIIVGEHRVESAVLHPGDLVQVGSAVLRFLPIDADAPTPGVGGRSTDAPTGVPGDLVLGALDRLRLGVVLLDARGRIAHENRSAKRLLDAKDGVSRGPTGALLLHTARGARPAAELFAASPDGALACPRRARRALSVMAGTLPGADEGLRVVFLADPEAEPDADDGMVQRLYGLTPTEARLAIRLARGQTLEEAATDLGIEISTARTHLKRAFAKTETRRQSELVLLLATGPSSVQPARRQD